MQRFSKSMDHLGLVAGMCDEVGLTQIIDQIIPPDVRAELSVGESLKLMIVNALGFSSRPLYLEADFFSSRPIKRLLGREISPEKISDDRLGRALDRLYEAGCEKLFSTVACEAFKQFRIDPTFRHLDTTSISVQGEYEEGIGLIEFGYSKDNQPGLKQFMISLITSQDGDVPMLAKTLAGNTSDKTHFLETLQQVKQGMLEAEEPCYYVYDSAGYTQDTLRAISGDVQWITRVPDTLNEVKQIRKQASRESMTPCGEGYRYAEHTSTYGGVKQRWLVVLSEKRRAQALKSLDTRIAKEAEQAQKACRKIQREEYACIADAQRAARAWEKTCKHHKINQLEIIAQTKRKGKGRPKAQDPGVTVYRLSCLLERDEEKIAKAQQGKGLFVIATNVLDPQQLTAEQLLAHYKEQQCVERGFRFLKDPRFMTSSVFLKKETRIIALGLVMCLSLLIYTLTQRKLRLELEKQGTTIPSQTGKPTKKPTIRWAYECFDGVHVFYEWIDQTWRESLLNMTELRLHILHVLGPLYQKMYEDAA